jgi:hypothetical protein
LSLRSNPGLKLANAFGVMARRFNPWAEISKPSAYFKLNHVLELLLYCDNLILLVYSRAVSKAQFSRGHSYLLYPAFSR